MDEALSAVRRRDSATSRQDDPSHLGAQISDAAPAICRICRGEGTRAEPLFYPCKCSGSIKYVHQDCLMEWLSHSQKKYCELCKTSFRFTKLYAPDMPQSVPVHVFLEHMAKHLVRNSLLWLRAIVTISVWVCWLPYFMRVVWAFMFWISDEGLGAGHFVSRQSTKALGDSILALNGTCARRNIFDEAIYDYGDKITFLNDTNSWNSPTLLSEVGFLKSLTRSSTLNRVFITILEGQIITILVIVCFVLVILVRDYVVQAQPEINMRAALAAEQENNPPAAVRPLVLPVLEDDDDDDDDDNHEPPVENRSEERALSPHLQEGHATHNERREDSDWSIAEPQADQELPHNQASGSSANEQGSRSLDQEGVFVDQIRTAMIASTVYRPEDEPREHTKTEKLEPTREELEQRIEVLEASRDEPKQQIMARRSAKENCNAGHDSSKDEDIQQIGQSNAPTDSVSDRHDSAVPFSCKSRESTREALKGKEVCTSTDPAFGHDVAGFVSNPGPSRPRALSDGADRQTSTNPLANNSWTFASLPSRDDHHDDDTSVGGPWASGALRSLAPSDDSNVSLPCSIPRMPPPDNVDHEDIDRYTEHDTDTIHSAAEEPMALHEAEHKGFVGRVAHFMWGDLDRPQEADAPQDPEADEAGDQEAMEAVDAAIADDQWIDEPIARPIEAHGDANAGILDGAAGQGMDAEAIEDLEDFEGVMELLGMRGPVAGLFQNAIFCAVLVSVTIFACVFIPYNIGRVSLWTMANPIHLVRMLMEMSRLVQDSAMMLFGFASWCALNIVDMFTAVLGGNLASKVVLARKAAWGIWTSAGSKVMEYVLMDFPTTATEIQSFSAISHEALNSIKTNIGWTLGQVDKVLSSVVRPDVAAVFDGRFAAWTLSAVRSVAVVTGSLVAILSNPDSWMIDLGEAKPRATVNPNLVHWSGLDRFWAIFTGYLTVFAAGALYLRRGSPFSRSAMTQAWEAGVIDTLHQASGVMKVILIISIEMLVFPLYCGLLLDGALLPLFENTTFGSRLLFTYNYPLTSVFVHWFVGTGYMFHFALFVSMCRKIMRPGVLYFIRDPDDPEFHPVRDVLERNLTTQLRKILFSAFVYGALVIVCLGGVVWGLCYAIPGVLPIHYSSNEPVLEFPVDLLFYNFLMPLAIKFFKPSDGLHAMYTWWLRKCARGLRLTYFLFGERRIDEEGVLQLDPELRGQVPVHRAWLLELNDDNRVVPKTWNDTFEGGNAKPNPSISKRKMKELRRRKSELVEQGQLEKNGRFVRAPASDRIKIPKGQRVFLAVSERGHRKDGNPDTDMYASDQYQLVYVPPNFRARILLFILFIWLFAAVTGVGFTILPLVIGRTMFKRLLPAHIRTNDIYAFSIGIYTIGSVIYAMIRLGHITGKFRDWINRVYSEVSNGKGISRIMSGTTRVAKLVYAYTFLLVVFPLAVSTLMELYVSMPLHTYMNPPVARLSNAGKRNVVVGGGDAGQHTVRVIQSWTLGLLYMNLATRIITSLFPDTRAAAAVRCVTRRGYLNPDVKVLTRAFVIPGIALSLTAIFGPPLVANVIIKLGFLRDRGSAAANAVRLSLLYRQSYPAAMLAVLLMRYAVGLTRVFHRWTAGVRDEAYLIGERLHNFGAATAGSRKSRKAWGAAAGGGRL